MLVVPVGLSLYLSLTDWDGYSANPAVVGLQNYVDLARSARRSGPAGSRC